MRRFGLWLSLLLSGCGAREILYKEKPITYWAERLRDRDEATRNDAVYAFHVVGSEGGAAVPRLISILHEPNPAVQAAAAEALGEIGPKAKEAVPLLMEVVQNKAEDYLFRRNSIIW